MVMQRSSSEDSRLYMIMQRSSSEDSRLYIIMQRSSSEDSRLTMSCKGLRAKIADLHVHAKVF